MSCVWPHRSCTVSDEGTMSMTISIKYDDVEEDNDDKVLKVDDDEEDKT